MSSVPLALISDFFLYILFLLVGAIADTVEEAAIAKTAVSTTIIHVEEDVAKILIPITTVCVQQPICI